MYIIYLEMSIKLKLKNLINFENSSYSHRDLKIWNISPYNYSSLFMFMNMYRPHYIWFF